MTYDRRMRKYVKRNPNLAVPWFLMSSYIYYHRDTQILSDGAYDWLCDFLRKNWRDVEHRHKELIDRKALKSGTAFYLKEAQYPGMAKGAACQLAGIPPPPPPPLKGRRKLGRMPKSGGTR